MVGQGPLAINEERTKTAGAQLLWHVSSDSAASMYRDTITADNLFLWHASQELGFCHGRYFPGKRQEILVCLNCMFLYHLKFLQ